MTDKILLHPGDRFPALTLALTGGGTLRLPDDLAGHFSVILCYRGSWCPCCNAQLRAFQRSLDRFADMDTLVIALSVDDETTTRDLSARHGLRFPVGHSADSRALATATGASSTTTRCTCSRPASCSTQAAGSWSAFIPAAPSDGWYPKTSSA